MSKGRTLKIELYHDVLARKVYERASREDKLRLQIERLLRDKLQFFKTGQGGLLLKDELSLINTYLDQKALDPDSQHYIQRSAEALETEEKKKIRRLRGILVLAIVAAGVFALLGLYARKQKDLAEKNEALANVNANAAARSAEQEKQLREEADRLNITLQATNLNLDTARQEALRQAQIAGANAVLAMRAEGIAKSERDSAERRAVAYRLLVLAMEEQKAGHGVEAFQIARRANAIFSGAAITDFARNQYNALPEKDKHIRNWKAADALKSAQITPAGTHLVLLGPTPSLLQVTDLKTAKPVVSLPVDDAVSAIVSADLRRALVVDEDLAIQFWDLSLQKIIKQFSGSHTLPAVAFGPDGRFGYSQKEQLQLCTAAGDPQATFTHASWVSRIAFSPDGRYLVAALANNELWLWDLRMQTVLARMAHQGPVNMVQFSPDSRLILSASNDETARLWNLRGQQLAKYSHYRNADESIFVTSAALSGDGRFCLTATDRNEVHLWDRQGTRLADYSLPSPALCVAFLPDGQSFLSVAQNGEVQIWKNYQAHIETFRPVDLPEIDLLGYEMPFPYWIETNDAQQLWQYARHYARQSDNFKEPSGHVYVLEKAAHLFEKAQARLTLSASERDSVSRWYGNLSWNQLLTGRCQDAERSARQGLALYPANRWINTNLAVSLVLCGRFEESQGIYLRLKDQLFDPDAGDTRRFREVFLEDLEALEKVGVRHGDFERVREVLR